MSNNTKEKLRDLCDPPPSMIERNAAILVTGSIGRIVGAMRQAREAGRREAGARMREACELLQDAREGFHSLENPDWDPMVRLINRFLEKVIGDKTGSSSTDTAPSGATISLDHRTPSGSPSPVLPSDPNDSERNQQDRGGSSDRNPEG